MKLRLSITLALACVLSGCAIFCPTPNANDPERAAGREQRGFDPAFVLAPNPNQPNVFVTESGQITVDQDPIRVRGNTEAPGRSTAKIVWALDRSNAFTFSEKTRPGIAFVPQDGAPLPTCVRQANGKVFACTFTGRAGQLAKYKYTVNLQGPNGLNPSYDPGVEVQF